ncbi:MAG: septum formation initiator family protein [Faecousia sp.]
MANTKSKVKIRLRKSSPVVKIALIAVLVISIVALLMLRSALQDTRKQTDELRQEAAGLEQSIEKLRQDLDDLGTIEGIVRLAKEKLGLVEPGSVVVSPEN